MGGGGTSVTEPTYTYVKGQGWVLQPENGKWKVLYRITENRRAWGPSDWTNADHEGFYYRNYERAEERYRQALRRLSQMADYYRGWEYKLVPASEFPEANDEHRDSLYGRPDD